MAAPKKPTRKPGASEMSPFYMRLPQSVIDDLDVWVEELNKTRGWPKLTRTDLIRNILSGALRERPDWVGK
jgi:hypothetical protein